MGIKDLFVFSFVFAKWLTPKGQTDFLHLYLYLKNQFRRERWNEAQALHFYLNFGDLASQLYKWDKMKPCWGKSWEKMQLGNWAATLEGERNKRLCAINNEVNWLFIVFVFVFVFVFLLYSICHCLYIKREGTISLSRPFSLCEAPERARLSWLTQLSHPPGRFVPKVHIYIFQQQYHHQRARLSYPRALYIFIP